MWFDILQRIFYSWNHTAEGPHVMGISHINRPMFSRRTPSGWVHVHCLKGEMQGPDIYAIVVGGILAGLLLTRAVSTLTSFTNQITILLFRHLTLPLIVGTHRYWGPWTRATALIHLSFVVVNVFLVFFRVKSLSSAGHRSGELALINLVFPLCTNHLSHLADLLGITLRTCRRIHRTSGWMGFALLSFHVIVAVQEPGVSFPLNESKNLWTMIVCSTAGSASSCALTF